MRRVLPFAIVALAIFAPTALAAAQADDAEVEQVLALCRSTDVAAQRFCLRRISTLPIEHEGAAEALWQLAQQPGPVGEDAEALYRVRYGEEVVTPAPPSQTPPTAPTAPTTPATAPPPAPAPAAPVPPPAPAPAPAYGPATYGPAPYGPAPYGPYSPYGPAQAPPVTEERPNDPSRLHFSPTGFVLGEGERVFTFQGPGFYKIGAGIAKNLQIEGGLVFPAGILAGVLNLRYGIPFGVGSVAVYGSVGGVWLPALESREGGFGLVRGGAALSLGDHDTFFNLGVDVGGGFYRFAGLSPTAGREVVAVFTAGFSARIARTASIRAEAIMPGLYRSGDGDDWGFARLGLVAWGFRLQGRRAFVDLTLNYLLHESTMRLYHTWPFGLPWLAVGFEI
jgi:hypothetical protein